MLLIKLSLIFFINLFFIQCDIIGSLNGGVNGIANKVVAGVTSPFESKLCRLDTCGLINYYGYRAEKHTVCTEDGYILTLFRASAKNSTMCNKRVVVIVHPLLGSSDGFCEDKPGQGLTYVMADSGYDVWLLNCRGNYYSRRHKHLDPDNPLSGFWKFSWDDTALKDLPAAIDYIRKCIKQKQVYMIGHSQGTSIIMAFLSEKPEYNQYMKAVCLLAPIGYLNNSGTLYRLLGSLEKPLKLIENTEFLPRSALSYVNGIVCQGLGSVVCESILKLLCGQSKDETNYKMSAIRFCHVTSGSSSTQFLHYGQEIKYGFFGRRMTGNKVPCDFPVHRITAPMFLQYSTSDSTGDPKDVERLLPKLTGSCDLCTNKITKPFNHLDFIS